MIFPCSITSGVHLRRQLLLFVAGQKDLLQIEQLRCRLLQDACLGGLLGLVRARLGPMLDDDELDSEEVTDSAHSGMCWTVKLKAVGLWAEPLS